MSEPKSANLYFTDARSDKVYNVQLEENPAGGWNVKFQYGARGKALRDGQKADGVSYEKALEVYDKLVEGKMKKGYTPEEHGATFSSTEMAGRDTGFRPQLLNEIDPQDARELGDDWLIGQKHDGERLGLIYDPEGNKFSNRKGLEIGVQKPVADAFAELAVSLSSESQGFSLDAENMGDHAVIFDVPCDKPFEQRVEFLKSIASLIDHLNLGHALVVEIPVPASKFFAEIEPGLREAGAEGFVAVHKDSLYEPGRPNSGGNALKVKYWHDMTCRVAAGRDGKRSVGIELLDGDGEWQGVGNVTIPANADIPAEGSLLDVKYLNATQGGQLYQPIYKCPRTDVDPEECRMDRLHYKVELDVREGRPWRENGGPGPDM